MINVPVVINIAFHTFDKFLNDRIVLVVLGNLICYFFNLFMICFPYLLKLITYRIELVLKLFGIIFILVAFISLNMLD